MRQRVHWSDRIAHAALAVVALVLLAFLAAPLASILLQALQDGEGRFVGLRQLRRLRADAGAADLAVEQPVGVGASSRWSTVPLAFGFAYALTRSCMPAKGLFRTITLMPLLAPSLLSAISLIYWFGNQGVLKGWLTALGIDADLRRAGHRAGRDLRGLPARADDPRHRADAGRRAPVRGRRRDGHDARGASSSPSRCRAPSTG